MDRLPACVRPGKIKLPAVRCANPLAFTMQHQDQTQWCWAATAVSVNLYYHPARHRWSTEAAARRAPAVVIQ